MRIALRRHSLSALRRESLPEALFWQPSTRALPRSKRELRQPRTVSGSTFIVARTALVLMVNGDIGIDLAISWLSSSLVTRPTRSRSRGVSAENGRGPASVHDAD